MNNSTTSPHFLRSSPAMWRTGVLPPQGVHIRNRVYQGFRVVIHNLRPTTTTTQFL